MRAEKAVAELDPASIRELANMRIPQEFLKFSLDAVAIYFGKKVVPVQYMPDLLLSKGVNINFMKNSF